MHDPARELSVHAFSRRLALTAMASAAGGCAGRARRASYPDQQEGPASPATEDLTAVVLTGDGSSYGSEPSSATSGAKSSANSIFRSLWLRQRGLRQYRPAGSPGPRRTGARTATSVGPLGFGGEKKDLFAIWAAHRPAYVATVIGAEPLDLARKVAKAKPLKGPRLLLALAPCPRVGCTTRRSRSRSGGSRSRPASGR